MGGGGACARNCYRGGQRGSTEETLFVAEGEERVGRNRMELRPRVTHAI